MGSDAEHRLPRIGPPPRAWNATAAVTPTSSRSSVMSDNDEEVYLFDLHLCCGGYAYFSTFTEWVRQGQKGREWRRPSVCLLPGISNRFDRLGRSFIHLRTSSAIEHWLLRGGWATVPERLAQEELQAWLADKLCITEPLDTFSDIDLVAPSASGRRPHRPDRDAIKARDGNRCLKCGAEENLTLHHIRAHSRGGSSARSNVCVLCASCNQQVGNELVWEFYDLAGQAHGWDIGLMGHEPSADAWQAAVELSGNLMRTRAPLE